MSDNDCNPINVKGYDFEIVSAGATSGTITGVMPIGGGNSPVSQVQIDGNPDLSKIIVGPDGASVKSIFYQSIDGIARNSVIYVYGQGPQGIGSGSLKLNFWTQNTSPDNPHDLSLTSSSPDCHNDKFSDGSDILKISWEHS